MNDWLGAAFSGIDSRTLLLAIALISVTLFALGRSSIQGMPDRRAELESWSQAVGALAIAALLHFLRGRAPVDLSFTLANLLVVFGICRLHFALARLLGFEPARRTVLMFAALGTAGVFATRLGVAPRNLTAFSVAVAFAAISAINAVSMWRHGPRPHSPNLHLGAAGFVVFSVTFGLRAGFTLSATAAELALPTDSQSQTGILVFVALCLIASSFSFLSLLHEKQQRELLEAARRDGLTGLLNHAAFMAQSREALVGAKRCCLLMIDIDNFKRINDELGHPAGDATIMHAARQIAASVRISDLAGRYGGDEFCVFLPDCAREHAAALVARLIEQAARQSVRLPDQRRVSYTLSIGFAGLDSRAERPAEAIDGLIAAADAALYAAKRDGRNRARIAETRSARFAT